jgi:predicted MFS family arabinose efflux permease
MPEAKVAYGWYVVVVLAVVNVFNIMDRTVLAVLGPLVKVDLGLSDTQFGVLTGAAFALFYAFCGIPIARWADRGVRRNIVALAVLTWSVMTALCGVSQNFWQLLLARTGVGAGEAGSYSPGASIICDYIPLRKRSWAFAIHTFGQISGLMIGMALAGLLGEIIGWRWAFAALGIPGILLALVVRQTVREPIRGTFDYDAGGEGNLSLRDSVRLLWSCKTYRLITIFLVVNGFVQSALNQWWPSFYVRAYGLNLSFVGIHLGIALGAGMSTGVLIGGLISTKGGEHDLRRPLRVGAVVTLLALPSALGSLFVQSLFVSLLFLSLTGLLFSVSLGTVMAAVFSVTVPRLRATAGAGLTFVTSVVGFGLGPLSVGMLSDVLARTHGAESLRYGLVAPVCLFPAMTAALLAAASALPNDIRHAQSSSVTRTPTFNKDVAVKCP